MPLSITARRTLVAREIRLSLAEAEMALQNCAPDARDHLEGIITALRERLHKRRSVVMEARYASLNRGLLHRFRRHRRQVVWGFPIGYNPNIEGDRCDVCRRTDAWVPRPIPDAVAWTCSGCAHLYAAPPNG